MFLLSIGLIYTVKSADSVEKEVVAMSQETGCVEEAEGVSICGIESPKSNILNDLDEALGQAFSQQSNWMLTFSFRNLNINLVFFMQRPIE